MSVAIILPLSLLKNLGKVRFPFLFSFHVLRGKLIVDAIFTSQNFSTDS